MTGSAVGVATTMRVGTGCLGLAAQRGPALVRLGIQGTARADSSAAFRDELIALARESAELSWHQMRRGVDELDANTRREDAGVLAPARPYRVKP